MQTLTLMLKCAILVSSSSAVTQAAPIPAAPTEMQQRAVQSSSNALGARPIDQQLTEELTPRDPSGSFDKALWSSEEFLKAVNEAREQASGSIPTFSLNANKGGRFTAKPKAAELLAAQSAADEWVKKLVDPNFKEMKRTGFATRPHSQPQSTEDKSGVKGRRKTLFNKNQAGTSSTIPDDVQPGSSQKRGKTADADADEEEWLKLKLK